MKQKTAFVPFLARRSCRLIVLARSNGTSSNRCRHLLGIPMAYGRLTVGRQNPGAPDGPKKTFAPHEEARPRLGERAAPRARERRRERVSRRRRRPHTRLKPASALCSPSSAPVARSPPRSAPHRCHPQSRTASHAAAYCRAPWEREGNGGMHGARASLLHHCVEGTDVMTSRSGSASRAACPPGCCGRCARRSAGSAGSR